MENYIKLTQKCIDGVLTINKNINMDDIKSIYINNEKIKYLNRKYDIYASDYEDLICDIVIELKKPIDCRSLFYDCYDIITIDLSNFDTSNITNMFKMFWGCRNLISITFGNNFNTSKVTDVSGMFVNCRSLTSLNLSSFDTSKITDMQYMFTNCRSLTSLDLSYFDTSKVTNMEYMFRNCISLKSLDLSHFDISHVTYIGSMFEGCYEIKNINIKNIKINEYNIILPQFLNNIKNVKNVIINPKNNLFLYRKLKEVKYS